MTVPPGLREQLEELLRGHAFTRAMNFAIASLGEGECSLEVPFQARHERPGGILSGQVYMHSADVAFWLAVKTRLGAGDGSTTSGMTTAFLSPARRENVVCEARVLRLGRRLIYGTAECRSLEGRLLTHHTLTYARSGAAAEA